MIKVKTSDSSSLSGTLSFPETLMQMITGFTVSKTIITAIELDLFTKLSGKSVTFKQLQTILEFEFRPTEVFVSALVALGLLVHSNSIKNQETKQKSLEKSIFENSKIAKEFLDKNNPITYIGDSILMGDKYLYPRWDNIVESLKTNRPLKAKTDKVNNGSAIYEKAKANKLSEQVQTFTRAMFGISVGPRMTPEKSFDFSNYTKLMDIGGDSGVYPIQIVKQQTNMNAVVSDSKPVCIIAEEYI